MKKPLTDEDLRERASIDGRVAFAAAAFAMAAGLVALLDRVGAPAGMVTVLGPAIALVGLAIVGLLLRNMRISRFYAGGRAVPATYAGLAFASLAAGLFIPFAPPVAGGPSFGLLLWGFAGGAAVAALIGGPMLRKTGAFSTPDLIASRFPNLALRLGVVAVVAGVGLLVAIAGFETAADALRRGAGLGASAAAVSVGAALLFILAPGGVAGLVWAAAGAAGVFLAGLGIPLALLYARGVGMPLPVFADTAAWNGALARFGDWNGGLGPASAPGAAVIMAVVIGIGGLSPLLSPASATRDTHAARGAGIIGLFWCVVFAGLAAATLALAILAIDASAVGARPEALSEAILEASRAGVLAVCGDHPASAAAARALCAARPGFGGALAVGDIAANGRLLLLALPGLEGLGSALSGLTCAGILAVSLVISAAGLHTFATAIGHDMFYRVRDASAMTSRRLAATRLIILLAIVAIAAVLAPLGADPRELIGLAIVFCGAAIIPLLALSLWPRAQGMDAAAALLAGLATTEAFIYLNGGIGSLEAVGRAAVLACGVSTLTGFVASLCHAADPAGGGGAFARGVLRGDGDMLNPDKGA